ncbi:hypothetical protein KUV85_12885 [Nocardioides panacisoli]|uniref:hypothetical protein n=1 Tax=Nocardioides panacisoli TaxID=627624 RepID=UPI001C62ACAD|nr:hypothetical protein [Nocardioides panacisoli]QYJ03226.1 hypothetical protein KUV85_12885 [Nocardioides panacisoli]
MIPRLRLLLALAVVATSASCGLIASLDEVYDSTVEPVDLALPAPTVAVATRDGLLLRAGEVRRLEKRATAVEWLPEGRAIVYYRDGVRLWEPATDELGPLRRLVPGELPVGPRDIKRSVTQVDVTVSSFGEEGATDDGTDLAAHDLDLGLRWQVDLPGVQHLDDDEVFDATRSYGFGHTIDGITYLPWSEYDATGEESDPHYGLLRVGPGGEVLDEVQVNERIKSMWLAADGSALLATRRTSGDPCGGCQVELELVELDPATGAVVAEYGMPSDYGKEWDVADVDKVGDRVAMRFHEFRDPDDEDDPSTTELMRGTWVLDDDGWTLLEGSTEEITWWQGPEDRIVARVADRPGTENLDYDLVWLHDGEETPLRGRIGEWPRGNYRQGSVPGQLLPPAG